MDLKKTILIAKSNLDDMRAAKEAIIREAENKKQLVKYSDNAVETKTKLYIFKTVILPHQVLDQIRGYAEVQADELLTELEKLVEEVRVLCGKSTDTPSSAPSKAPEGSPRGAKVEDDVDDSEEGQNEGGDDK
jgi:hypothetical protein